MASGGRAGRAPSHVRARRQAALPNDGQRMSAATGMPVFDAHEDFARARRAAQVARVGRWLGRRHRPGVPRTPEHSDWLPREAPQARVIPLAHHRGTALPPIDVLQRPDGYCVADGRHRVSVARALGRRDIDARVTSAWDTRPIHSAGGRRTCPPTAPTAARRAETWPTMRPAA